MDPNPSSTPIAINGSNGLKAPPNNPVPAAVPPVNPNMPGTFPIPAPIPAVPAPAIAPVPVAMAFGGTPGAKIPPPPPIPANNGISGPISRPPVPGGCCVVDPPAPDGVVPAVKIGIEMVVDESPSKLAYSDG